MPGEPMIFEADHYRETRAALREEGIVKAMFDELPPVMVTDLVNNDEYDGFMQVALNEYHNRGGQKANHIGSVLQVLREYAREATKS